MKNIACLMLRLPFLLSGVATPENWLYIAPLSPLLRLKWVGPGLTIRFELVYHWQRHSRLNGWFSTSYNTSKLRLISAHHRSPRPRSDLF